MRKVFEAYLINKQIVFQNNIIEKYYKIRDPNYIETFQDCIRMALILHIITYYRPHDYALFLILENIRAIFIQS